jgi:threonine dehydrogenase-like Zn-dependent dehydrogenase
VSAGTSCRAALAVGPYSTELRELPVPEVGEDDALLQVEAAAVCGTDWEIYGRERLARDLGPLILGHENVGRVAAIGEAAAERWGVEAGDRVAVEEFIPCGRCRLCRSGRYRLCEATDFWSEKPFLRYGATPVEVEPGLWGGFSEYQYLHPRAIVYPASADVPAEVLSLFVPVANGIRWVLQVAGASVGQSIVIQGPGQHGLGCVIAARSAELGPIVVAGTGRDRERLKAATALGADRVVNVDEEDLVTAVTDATDGAMADVVVDVSPGATAPVEAALEIAAKGATVILAGYKHGEPVAGFSNDAVVRKELTIHGVRGHDHASIEPALALIADDGAALERLCTHRYGLDQVDEALRAVGERPDESAIHVTVVP